ncbi:MAG: tetratricopeptide repeat protein [Pirellulaceae bacterium]|nr:tetratricopeptide repeat protein [Pirellulaceae bacterium]
MAEEFTFKLNFDDFDLDLVEQPNLDRSSPLFVSVVNEFFVTQFQGFGGRARVIVNESAREIEVRWTKGGSSKDPKDAVLELLNRGQLQVALPMIWTLIQNDPSDLDNYYNLGVVYSELRNYPKAIEILERLVAANPKHVHGLTALGVAEIRSNNLLIGEEWLTQALKLDSENKWALKNLGACLLKQGRFSDAIPILRRCVMVAPQDVQAIVALGEALVAVDQIDEADVLFDQAIKIGGPDEVLDIAKKKRTKRAQDKLRGKGGFRPDSMMYMVGALNRFKAMSKKEIQLLGFEIALLGMKGLDINDPSEKYTLKAWQGNFSGLHLLSIMYAAFKQFAPNDDVGIDLSGEYESALESMEPN